MKKKKQSISERQRRVNFLGEQISSVFYNSKQRYGCPRIAKELERHLSVGLNTRKQLFLPGKWQLRIDKSQKLLFHSDRGVQYANMRFTRLRIQINWLEEACAGNGKIKERALDLFLTVYFLSVIQFRTKTLQYLFQLIF
jgi:hypothetical protein